MGGATKSPRRPASAGRKFGDDPGSVADAQAAIVMQKGFLDDVIDGVQLGLLAIAVICVLLAAVFGSSLPVIFPAARPVYEALAGVPGFVRDLPALAQSVWEARPSSLEEAVHLGAILAAEAGDLLHRLPYKECVLVFSWATYLWETSLDIRQRDRLHEVRRPLSISTFISRQVYLEANAYGLDKSSLALVKGAVEQVQTTLIIVYDLIPALWRAVGDLASTHLGMVPEQHLIAHSVMFFVAAVAVSTALSLPFNMYSTFVVEKKHGFNKQTWGLFVSDAVKSFLLVVLFGAPVVAAFLWVIDKTGSRFYLYTWALMAAVQLLAIVIYPTLIQPLFNKFDPLPNGELRTAIEALASRLRFPLKKLYVVDGSKRSSHSNAYVFGFFRSKRIVVYDTLIQQCTTEEIVAVVGHELGHWKMNHVPRMLAMAQVQIFLVFFAFGCFVGEEAMYASFGVEGTPVMLGFVFFQYLYEPLGSLLQFCSNAVSRLHEFQADAFSKRLGYGKQLASCLIKLQIENKSAMNPDPLYSAYHYSHPPLVERLNALGNPHVAPKTE
ncbi:zinc metalloprotease [Coemansia javaensis]|uniref:CAAX prenyl protease 1 homolog n=1 Tax=Coemansia javaensis TaxID=2761396 RepID=A0A9W8LED5_9FUNG|nr:zinc metalloprotease [Coemansia javaensis]